MSPLALHVLCPHPPPPLSLLRVRDSTWSRCPSHPASNREEHSELVLLVGVKATSAHYPGTRPQLERSPFPGSGGASVLLPPETRPPSGTPPGCVLSALSLSPVDMGWGPQTGYEMCPERMESFSVHTQQFWTPGDLQLLGKVGNQDFYRDSPHQPCYTNRPWVISPIHSNVHVSWCQWL